MRYCIYCFDGDGRSELSAHLLEGRTKEVLVRHRDPFRPILAGDYIFNKKYDHTLRLKFFVGTRTPFRSRDEIIKFIEENGGVVATEIGPDVDYFVPGADRDSDAAVKRARQLGIRIMTSREVFHWFGKPKSE